MFWPKITQVNRGMQEDRFLRSHPGTLSSELLRRDKPADGVPADEVEDSGPGSGDALALVPELASELGMTDMLREMLERVMEHPRDRVLPAMAGREPHFREAIQA